LRSWRIVSFEESDIHQEQENENDRQLAIKPSTVVIIKEIEQGENIVEQQNPDKDIISLSPPLPISREANDRKTTRNAVSTC
jgi:hypothetical protein